MSKCAPGTQLLHRELFRHALNMLQTRSPFNRPVLDRDLHRSSKTIDAPQRVQVFTCRLEIIAGFLCVSNIESSTLEKQFPQTKDRRSWIQAISIDFRCNRDFFQSPLLDQPRQTELIRGKYPIPPDCTIIRIRIVDLLSNVFEAELKKNATNVFEMPKQDF